MRVNKLEVQQWIDEEVELGRFDKHLAAYSLLQYYVRYMWTVDACSKYPDAKKMHVMSGCIWPAVVARKIPVSKRQIEKDNRWLERQGYLKIQWGMGPRGGSDMPLDIEVLLMVDGENRSWMVGNNAPDVGGSELSSSGSELSALQQRTEFVHKENIYKETINAHEKKSSGLVQLASVASLPIPKDGSALSSLPTKNIILRMCAAHSLKTCQPCGLKDGQIVRND